MAMKFSPKMEAMLAAWEARVRAQPLRKLTQEERDGLLDVRKRQAWTDALKSGDAITADRYLAEYTSKGW